MRNDITQNKFEHPKFSANASHLVLIPKKIGSGDHYNFIFFLNHVLSKIERTLGEPMRKPLAFFLKKIIIIKKAIFKNKESNLNCGLKVLFKNRKKINYYLKF